MGEGIGTGLDEDEDPDAWQRDTDSCPWAATMMQLDGKGKSVKSSVNVLVFLKSDNFHVEFVEIC